MPSFDLNSISALILDMDGVLWRGAQPLGDLPAIFEQIAQRGWNFALATNNSTRTVDEYVQKLAKLSVRVEPWQVITSAEATANYLFTRFPEGGNVFVVGENGLVQTLKEKGFKAGQEDVIAVIAGLDKGLSYEKLSQATHLVLQGAAFIGTNPDLTYPTPTGLAPGAGAIIAALEAATGKSAKIIGKPASDMFLQALKRLGTSPDETLVIGDRLETDIAGAQAAGCWTALALSGVTTKEQAKAWTPNPDLILPDLAGLFDIE